MDALEQMREIEAIKQLKYRYFRALDCKQWDHMRACLAPDATAAYSGGKYHYEGREAILGFLTESLGRGSILTMHHGHHPEIELTSATTATGIWALEDRVIDVEHEVTIRGAAYYRDEYVKRDGAWVIQHTGYERLFEEVESRKERAGLRLTAKKFE